MSDLALAAAAREYTCKVCRSGGILEDAIVIAWHGNIALAVHPACLHGVDVVLRAVPEGVSVKVVRRQGAELITGGKP